MYQFALESLIEEEGLANPASQAPVNEPEIGDILIIAEDPEEVSEEIDYLKEEDHELLKGIGGTSILLNGYNSTISEGGRLSGSQLYDLMDSTSIKPINVVSQITEHESDLNNSLLGDIVSSSYEKDKDLLGRLENTLKRSIGEVSEMIVSLEEDHFSKELDELTHLSNHLTSSLLLTDGTSIDPMQVPINEYLAELAKLGVDLPVFQEFSIVLDKVSMFDKTPVVFINYCKAMYDAGIAAQTKLKDASEIVSRGATYNDFLPMQDLLVTLDGLKSTGQTVKTLFKDNNVLDMYREIYIAPEQAESSS